MKQETFHLEISEDAFDAHYPLVTNHFNPHSSWSFLDTGGCLFETYGEEFEFVRQQDSSYVWTFVDGDEGQYLISGLHFVNRIGYLVSKIPVPEGVYVQVRLTGESVD